MSERIRAAEADSVTIRERRQRLGLTISEVRLSAGVPSQNAKYADSGKGPYADRYEQAIKEFEDRNADCERISHQRSLFPADAGAFKVAILERVWTLHDAGKTEAADELLSFLPESDAAAILEEFFNEPEAT